MINDIVQFGVPGAAFAVCVVILQNLAHRWANAAEEGRKVRAFVVAGAILALVGCCLSGYYLYRTWQANDVEPLDSRVSEPPVVAPEPGISESPQREPPAQSTEARRPRVGPPILGPPSPAVSVQREPVSWVFLGEFLDLDGKRYFERDAPVFRILPDLQVAGRQTSLEDVEAALPMRSVDVGGLELVVCPAATTVSQIRANAGCAHIERNQVRITSPIWVHTRYRGGEAWAKVE